MEPFIRRMCVRRRKQPAACGRCRCGAVSHSFQSSSTRTRLSAAAQSASANRHRQQAASVGRGTACRAAPLPLPVGLELCELAYSSPPTAAVHAVSLPCRSIARLLATGATARSAIVPVHRTARRRLCDPLAGRSAHSCGAGVKRRHKDDLQFDAQIVSRTMTGPGCFPPQLRPAQWNSVLDPIGPLGGGSATQHSGAAVAARKPIYASRLDKDGWRLRAAASVHVRVPPRLACIVVASMRLHCTQIARQRAPAPAFWIDTLSVIHLPLRR